MMQYRALVSCFFTGLKCAFTSVSELKNSLAKQLSASRTLTFLLQATVIHLPHFQTIILIVFRCEFFVFDFLIDFSGVFAYRFGHLLQHVRVFCLDAFKPNIIPMRTQRGLGG